MSPRIEVRLEVLLDVRNVVFLLKPAATVLTGLRLRYLVLVLAEGSILRGGHRLTRTDAQPAALRERVVQRSHFLRLRLLLAHVVMRRSLHLVFQWLLVVLITSRLVHHAVVVLGGFCVH